MPVCTEVVPPEVRFDDGVRVACHLYPPGSTGTPVAVGAVAEVGADAAPSAVPA